MNKKLKKVFTIVMILTMVFTMSSVAFATSGSGSYVVGSAVKYNHPINVKVVIESKQYSTSDSSSIEEVLDVTLGEEGVPEQTFTVRDAIYKISSTSSYGITACDSHGNAITPSATMVYSMKKDNKIYAPGLPSAGTSALDGWMFRVNGKLPLISEDGSSGGPLGSTISETPIEDGDIIHFYWDYPYTRLVVSTYSVDYLTVNPTYDSTNQSLSLQLLSAKNWFDLSFKWHINDFSNYSNSSSGTYDVTVYDEAGTVVKTGTISKSGSGTINDCDLESGQTYYIKVDSVSYKTVGTGSNKSNILNTTMAYEKIEVQ